MLKNLPAVQETCRFKPWVRKIPLEKEMATHSSILAWRIPWTKEPGELQSMGSQRAGHDLATKQQQNNGLVKAVMYMRSLPSLWTDPFRRSPSGASAGRALPLSSRPPGELPLHLL